MPNLYHHHSGHQQAPSEFIDHQYCSRNNLNLSRAIKRPEISARTEYNRCFKAYKTKDNPIKNELIQNTLKKAKSLIQLETYPTEYNKNYQHHNLKHNEFLSRKKQHQVKKKQPFYGLTTYNSVFTDFKAINKNAPIKQYLTKNPLKTEESTINLSSFQVNQNRQQPSQTYLNRQKQKKTLKNSQFIGKKINKSLLHSTYKSCFQQKRQNLTAGKYKEPETSLIFNLPIKERILNTKTSYISNFSNLSNHKFDNPEQNSKRIVGKEMQFHIYKKKQVDSLKQRLKSMI